MKFKSKQFHSFLKVNLFSLLIGLNAIGTNAFAAPANWLVRITAMAAYESENYSEKQSSGQYIDIKSRLCDEVDENNDGIPETQTYEDIYDTVIGMTVKNESNSTNRFNNAVFKIANADSTGRALQTRKFIPLGNSEVPAGKSVEIYAFLLGVDGFDKYLPSKIGNRTLTAGFKNINVTLEGRTTAGKKFTIKAKQVFSFADHDRC